MPPLRTLPIGFIFLKVKAKVLQSAVAPSLTTLPLAQSTHWPPDPGTRQTPFHLRAFALPIAQIASWLVLALYVFSQKSLYHLPKAFSCPLYLKFHTHAHTSNILSFPSWVHFFLKHILLFNSIFYFFVCFLLSEGRDLCLLAHCCVPGV